LKNKNQTKNKMENIKKLMKNKIKQAGRFQKLLKTRMRSFLATTNRNFSFLVVPSHWAGPTLALVIHNKRT
jgi:hypothetical protein